jgi:hypothetical protein
VLCSYRLQQHGAPVVPVMVLRMTTWCRPLHSSDVTEFSAAYNNLYHGVKLLAKQTMSIQGRIL